MAHILVIDDRAMSREFLATLLDYYGHTLAEAGDGVEALARVRERRPDLIITDLLMPNMDGEEFTRRLRADPGMKDVPVIIYTATYRAREAREIADRVSVCKVLAKPSEPKEIIAAVAEALGVAAPEIQPLAPDARPPPMRDSANLVKGVEEQLETVQGLAHLLANASKLAEQPGRSLTAVRELESALQSVQALGLRLTGLVKLGLDLARARDPKELIELFCRALQDILSAHYAGVVVLSGKGTPVRQFAARGLDVATGARVAGEIAYCAAATRVLGLGGRLVIAAKPTDVAGLPASHPPVKNFLACALAAHDKTIGWMYVADRLGDASFGTDDERIAMALAAQFAIAWDSLGLYTELDRLVAERTRQLEVSNRDLESFSYSVSHDLRAPLRAIGGFSGILLRDFAAQLPPKAVELVQRVTENVKGMGKLIDDLLEFSRMGRKALSLGPVNLAYLARECLKELSGEQEGRRVEVVIGAIPPCHGDVILLKQALLNLLSNALKYSRPRAATRIEVGGEIRGAEFVGHVRDNGVGFDMQQAGRLFEVFQRLHVQSQFEGTGVGLAIVRRVLEKHGGRVWAEAALDQGATFYFSLPAATAEQAVGLSLPTDC